MTSVLFTIGFTQKGAEDFFTKLKRENIKKLLDIRLNRTSQLSGFARYPDLPYFLREICQVEYTSLPILAPTKILLDSYKDKKISWPQYEEQYQQILLERNPENSISLSELNQSCFLCSEHIPDNCHRRLAAEYFQKKFSPNLSVKHIM